MKRNVKMIIMVVMVLVLGGLVGFKSGYSVAGKAANEGKATIEESTTKFEVKQVLTRENELEGLYLDENDVFVEFTDNSYAIVNYENEYFSFQPINMLDWNYEANSIEQLEDIIKCYAAGTYQITYNR